MIPHLLYYQLAVLGCLWLFVMLCSAWPSPGLDERPQADPTPPQRKRTNAPKAFAGLTHKQPRKIGDKIRGIFHWCALSSPYILVTSILLSVAFPFLAWLHNPLGKAFVMAGECLLGLKSPEEYSQLLPGFLYYLAWMISFFGWLFIPLTIGVALDLLEQWNQRSREMRFYTALLASDFGLSGAQSRKFQDEACRVIEELVDQYKGTGG